MTKRELVPSIYHIDLPSLFSLTRYIELKKYRIVIDELGLGSRLYRTYFILLAIVSKPNCHDRLTGAVSGSRALAYLYFPSPEKKGAASTLLFFAPQELVLIQFVTMYTISHYHKLLSSLMG